MRRSVRLMRSPSLCFGPSLRSKLIEFVYATPDFTVTAVKQIELQEEQLAIHQQATAAAAANKQVTIESLIAEAEAARAKAMSEKGGAAAAVSALTAKAKLAGMWREKVDQHNTGTGTVSTVWSVSWDEEGEQSDGRKAS